MRKRRLLSLAVPAALILGSGLPRGLRAEEPAILASIEAGEDEVILHLTEQVQYEVASADEPPRLLLDLHNVRHLSPDKLVQGRGRVLVRIRSGELSGRPVPTARLAIELREMVPYQVSWDGGNLILRLGERAKETSPAAAAPKPSPVLAPKPARKPGSEKPQAKPAAGGSLAVQLGAFAQESRALAVKEDVEPVFAAVAVVPVETGGKKVYKVRIEPMKDRAEAEAVVKKLSDMGYKPIIVPTK